MRVFRFLLIVVAIVLVGWLAWRSVSVDSTPDKLQITIDKRELNEAGHVAVEKGRQAVDKAGAALKKTGEKLEHWEEGTQPKTPPPSAPGVPADQSLPQ